MQRVQRGYKSSLQVMPLQMWMMWMGMWLQLVKKAGDMEKHVGPQVGKLGWFCTTVRAAIVMISNCKLSLRLTHGGQLVGQEVNAQLTQPGQRQAALLMFWVVMIRRSSAVMSHELCSLE